MYSSEDSGRMKCLVINEDMTHVEIVSGFRKDVTRIERILSSLHLERLLQAFHEATVCSISSIFSHISAGPKIQEGSLEGASQNFFKTE